MTLFSRPRQPGRCFGVRPLVFAALAFLCASLAARGGDDQPAHGMRLRLEWGGSQKSLWTGLIEISEGQFSGAASLGVEADEPGTLWIEGNAVWIQRRTARVYDGMDVTVNAPDSAHLTLSLKSADGTGEQPIRIPLSDVRREGLVRILDHSGTRLVVRRTPGDSLPVRVDRPHLVYSPREKFSCNVEVPVPAARWLRGKGSLTWQISGARGGAVLERGGIPIPNLPDAERSATVEVEMLLPSQEGAWDIAFAVSGVGWDKPESSVQVVVVAPKRTSEHEAARAVLNSVESGRETVDSFAPATAPAWRGVRSGGPRESWTSSLKQMIGIAADSESANPESRGAIQWQAYYLKLNSAGQPHQLVVRARPNSGRCLGISILEPNAAGQLMPVGIDSGMVAPRRWNEQSPPRAAVERLSPSLENIQAATATEEHRLLFWPRTTKPIVLIHDLGLGEPLSVEQIEAVQLGSLAADSVAIPSSVDPLPQRLAGPYLHKPMLPENFGAAEALDRVSRRSLDDWQTFHSAGTRLVEYLKHTAYNSLLLAVYADGSTIYPSELLQPTPRYDTGAFFSTGQDVMRKDVVEMLLRLFDREGLTLLPELQFSTPLPALERELSQGRQASQGIELIGGDGRSWREARGTNRGLAPHYNPLDPRVQQAVCDVVAEFARRYREHPALAGIAVELSSEGYLQLPGLNWGYDDATIARFERDTGVTIPVKPGDAGRFEVRQRFLTTTARPEWVRWRCAELSRFHMRLAGIVQEHLPRGLLVLSANRMLRGPNPDDPLDENMGTGGRISKVLSPKGLEFLEYAKADNLIVLSPALWESPADSRAVALDESINYSDALTAALGPRNLGRLCYHEPRECRIADFDSLSPWQPAYTWLAAHVSFAGDRNRERWARSLAGDARMVFDGGWMTLLGQERHSQDIRKVLQALPAIAMHPVKAAQQPLTVRMGRERGHAYLLIVNDMSEPVQAQLTVQHGAAAVWEPLGRTGGYRAAAGHGGTSTDVSLELAAYDAVAFRISDPNTQVDRVRVHVAPNSLQLMADRIGSLDRSLLALQSDMRGPALLSNPGFETSGDSQQPLPGWEVDRKDPAAWSLDTQQVHSGKQALMLASYEQKPATVSSALPLSNERAVTLSVWLKGDRPRTQVQMAFEATVDRKPRTQSISVQVDSEWKKYVFRIRDLPERSLENARLKISLEGPGRIWVDDAEIALHRISEDDARQIAKLASSVRLAWDERRYADCERMLNSYWIQLLDDRPAPSAEPAGTVVPPSKRHWFWPAP